MPEVRSSLDVTTGPAAPVVTLDPLDQTVTDGTPIPTPPLTSAATGTPPPTCQWRSGFGGPPSQDIAGQTSPTLPAFASSAGLAGTYSTYLCRWTNEHGVADSAVATVTVT